MKRTILALLLMTALSPAFAADDPALIPGSNDTRVRMVEYSASRVTRLTSTDMTPITITFGDNERATLIAGLKVITASNRPPPQGQAAPPAAQCADWCADRHGNELTLQPLRPDDGSMLVVTTEKAEEGRTIRHHYAYELRTRTGTMAEELAEGRVTRRADPLAYFRVLYRYSAEEAAKRRAEAPPPPPARPVSTLAVNAGPDAPQDRRMTERLTAAVFRGPRNYRWMRNESAGCRALAPDRVSDDGRQTVLHFRMNAPVSQPNVIDQDGKESSASFHSDRAPDSGLVTILHQAPERIVLRRGEQVCGLYNSAFNPSAAAPDSGTSAPEVVRVTK